MTNSFPTRRSSGLVVRSIFSVGHSPSVYDHRGVQVLPVRPTDCNDTPVPVAIFRFPTPGGTAAPLVKGNGRLLAAASFIFAEVAGLRSGEGRVGKEGGNTCRNRGTRDLEKKKKT